MRKQKITGIAVAVLALLLAGCSNSQTTVESTVAQKTTEAETTVIPETTIPEPKLEASMTELEIGYGLPVTIQGEIPISRPETAEEKAKKETEAKNQSGSESTAASTEEQQTESEEYSEGKSKQVDTDNREPVTIQLSMTEIEDCSYEVRTIELAVSWEEEYREGEGTSEADVSEKSEATGYHFEGDQLIFDHLGQYEIIFSAKGTDGQELSETIAVTVVDDVPPMLYVPEEITCVAGEDWIGFLSECVAEDEIDGDLFRSIVFQDERENPFDPETPGEYLLRFSVRDHSNNEAVVITHITVTEKKVASNSSNDSGENIRKPDGQAADNDQQANAAENGGSEPDIPENQEVQRPPETQAPAEMPVAPEAPVEVPAPAPEPEPEPEVPAVTSEYLDGSSIVGLINSARAEAGLGEVSWESGLLDLAQTRANEQSIKTGHERPDGSHILQYYAMGECTAWGYPSVQAVFDAWMASDGHRAAILWETHTKCCLAGYKDSSGTYWVLILE